MLRANKTVAGIGEARFPILVASHALAEKAENPVKLYWGGYWPFHGRAHRPSEEDGVTLRSVAPLLIATFAAMAVITALGIRRLTRRTEYCMAPQNISAVPPAQSPFLQPDGLPLPVLLRTGRAPGHEPMLQNSKRPGVSAAFSYIGDKLAMPMLRQQRSGDSFSFDSDAEEDSGDDAL